MWWDRRRVRLALGLLWLLDAALQAQPVFFHPEVWRQDIAQSVMGEPPWVAHGVFWAIGVIAAHPAIWDGAFVAIQAALGLALVTDRLPRVAIVTSVPYALAIWWVGEGFGTLPTGFAMFFAGSPGPALLYPVLGLLAWPGSRRQRGTPVHRRWALGLWAALWAGQAVLLVPWLYPVREVLTANLEENGLDAPHWLLPVVHQVSSAVASAPVTTTAALAALQVLVGIGALVPTTRRAALAVGIVSSVAFWVIGQDFGGIFVSGGTDPSTAPLVILLALALWPTRSVVSVRSPQKIPSRIATAP